MNLVIEDLDCGAPECEERVGSARVLEVTLESLDGQRWTAVGGGETVEEALQFALGSAPAGIRWHVAGWNDLYGD